MKKIFFFVLLVAISIISMAQIPFIRYEPLTIPTPSQPSTSVPSLYEYSQSRQQPDNFQVIRGYFINRRGAFEKISLKVNVVSEGYFTRVWVRGYYQEGFGWHYVNNEASEVSSRDDEVIQENFDYKCYLVNVGTVYF